MPFGFAITRKSSDDVNASSSRYTYLVETSLNTIVIGTRAQFRRRSRIKETREALRWICFILAWFFAIGTGTTIHDGIDGHASRITLSILGILIMLRLATMTIPTKCADLLDAITFKALEPPIMLPITAFNSIAEEDRHEVATRLIEMHDSNDPQTQDKIVRIFAHLRTTSTRVRTFE